MLSLHHPVVKQHKQHILIHRLKEEHKELLITKQWNVLFPKGFKPGNNVIPVVTTSKQGKYLVGELLFYLTDRLELDKDNIEHLESMKHLFVDADGIESGEIQLKSKNGRNLIY